MCLNFYTNKLDSILFDLTFANAEPGKYAMSKQRCFDVAATPATSKQRYDVCLLGEHLVPNEQSLHGIVGEKTKILYDAITVFADVCKHASR